MCIRDSNIHTYALHTYRVHTLHTLHTHYRHYTHTHDPLHNYTTIYTTDTSSALVCISEPQRGPTGGGGIIDRARCAVFWVLSRRLPPGSRLWLIFPSPREGRQEGCESLISPGELRFGCPREGRQEGCESLASPGVLRFGCSPDVSLQDLGSG